MRALWFLAMIGCGAVGSGGAPPAPLCDAAAPTDTLLDAWSGGGMSDEFAHFVDENSVRQRILVDGDCRYRAYDVDTTGGLPIAQWREGMLTADEAADIATRLELGAWPPSRDDSVPDAGVMRLTFDGDTFECFTCEQEGGIVTGLRNIIDERVAAGTIVAPVGVDVLAWVAGSSGHVEADPDDWRFAWTLTRSPADFVSADRTAVAAEPDEVAFFVGVLDEARAGAFASGQWSFVTEHEGVVYQLYLREVLPTFP